eukprot:1145265-Pelagomonas_calceolata.AAC.2
MTFLECTHISAGSAGAFSLLTDMVQILECRPDSCLARAMLLSDRLDLACCTAHVCTATGVMHLTSVALLASSSKGYMSSLTHGLLY